MSARLVAALAPLRDRVGPALAQVKGRWRALSERERVQIAAMAILVVGVTTWLLLVKPALETTRHWQQELPKLRSQAKTLKDVLVEAGVTPVTPVAAAGAPGDRNRRLRESLDAAGLAGAYRLGATVPGGGPIDIDFNIDVSPEPDPARVLSWLMQAPPGLRMTVSRISIERGGPSPSPSSATSAPGGMRVMATLVAQ